MADAKIVTEEALSAIASDIKTALGSKADTSSIPTKVSDLTNDSDFQTGDDVDTAIASAIANKADIDGEYDLMTVGLAKQLKSNVGENDKVPYNFRTSGGSIDIGDRETDMLVGGTVAFNQLKENGNFVDLSSYIFNIGNGAVNNNELTFTSGSGNRNFVSSRLTDDYKAKHKYLIRFDYKSNLGFNIQSFVKSNVLNIVASNNYITYAYIIDNDEYNSAYNTTYFYNYSELVAGDWILSLKNFVIFDLTAMFGSTIADYIYTLESGTAGAGVAFFRSLFPKSYYAYNAGELMSVKTSAHRMIGFNAYNNTSGKAKVIGGYQYQITGTYTSLTLDGESITPDGNGKFTPSTNGEITVVGGNATDTCIHLVWDGERNGEYEAYEEHVYALDGDLELRGIPKLDANNKLYYDGDTYESDGTVTRKYEYRAYASGDESLPDTITDGTHTVTKLVTPTTETADTFTNPQIVNDFGTEEYVDTRDVAIPVGHETFYQANLRAKLEMSPDSPSGNGDYIVRQTDGQNEYVVLTKELPTLPSTDGTYMLKCTVSGGTPTLSWVADT